MKRFRRNRVYHSPKTPVLLRIIRTWARSNGELALVDYRAVNVDGGSIDGTDSPAVLHQSMENNEYRYLETLKGDDDEQTTKDES